MDAWKTDKLKLLASLLVDQRRARVLISPKEQAQGFWFGGGNIAEDPKTGALWVCGRYRNAGDSRQGLQAGERGAELAFFCGDSGLRELSHRFSLSKNDLKVNGKEVLSIEGANLRIGNNGAELFVSTEKMEAYPAQIADFQKPGTGVWSIDYAQADSADELKHAEFVTIASGRSPEVLHVKDPVVYDAANGDTVLIFCTHPFNWSSANSACMVRPAGSAQFHDMDVSFFPRGFCWDVAMSRITCIYAVPPTGCFSDSAVSLVFYDGGECMRNLDEHTQAVKRPRGYSCEELGGLAVMEHDRLACIRRISAVFPEFMSPWGTGSSRYADVLSTADYCYVSWQQSRKDRSQPLMVNVVSQKEIRELLEK